MRSLAQFQALQDGEKELASLRDLGLTDTEIELWRNRDVQDTGITKVSVQPIEGKTLHREKNSGITCNYDLLRKTWSDLHPSHNENCKVLYTGFDVVKQRAVST